MSYAGSVELDVAVEDSLGLDYERSGLVVAPSVVPSSLLSDLRREIVEVISVATGLASAVSEHSSQEHFETSTSEILWELVNVSPHLRTSVYGLLQRLPALHQVVALPFFYEFARQVGITKPLVREAKLQMFLPWEPMFFQDCHQDINSLESERSVTYWIPLVDLPEERAVRYWVGSHVAGPVKHEIVEDKEQGIFLERIPLNKQREFEEVRATPAKIGDVIALNRLLFHKSPDFETQDLARWSIVLRVDDFDRNALENPGPKFVECLPYSEEQIRHNLGAIRQILMQPPRIDWLAKRRNLERSASL